MSDTRYPQSRVVVARLRRGPVIANESEGRSFKPRNKPRADRGHKMRLRVCVLPSALQGLAHVLHRDPEKES